MVAFTGCENKKAGDSTPFTASAGGVAAAGLSNTDAGTDSAMLLPRIDASTLKVYNLIAGNYENQGVKQEVVSFSVDPRTTYISYKICPLEPVAQSCPKGQLCAVGGECWEQVTQFNRVALSYVGGGKIQISAQACVDAQSALTNTTCGPTTEIIYNSNRYEGETADLLSTREYIFAQYKIASLKMSSIMDDFMLGARADLADPVDGCLQNNLRAIRALQVKVDAVSMYLQAPVDETMDLLRSNVATGAVLEGLSITLSKINDGLTKFCQDMAALTGTTTTCTVMQAIATVFQQLLFMLLPQNMLSTLVTAIKDLEDGSVARRCTAEEIFNKKFLAINQLQQALFNQLQGVNAKLKSFGL